MGDPVTAAVVIGGIGAATSYQQGREQRQAIKDQYAIDEYNAKMDKAEQEVELAKQEKLLQKQLAETISSQNNVFGAMGIDPSQGSAFDIMTGTVRQGQEDSRTNMNTKNYLQNKYNTTSAIRRQQYKSALSGNRISTGLNMISGGISGGMSGYSLLK